MALRNHTVCGCEIHRCQSFMCPFQFMPARFSLKHINSGTTLSIPKLTNWLLVRLISSGALPKITLSREKTIMNRINRYSMWTIAAFILTIGSIAGGAFAGAALVQAGHAPEAALAAAAPPVRQAAAMPATFAPVVKAVLPAVVNISSTKMIRTSALRQDNDNPFGDLIPGFRMPDRPLRRQGEGSGVIVNPDGYIVTN